MNDNVAYKTLKQQKSKAKCMKSLVKTLLLFFNLILMFCSIGIIIYCSIYFHKRESYITNLIGTNLFIAYYLLILSGIILLVIVIVGFIGIGKNIINMVHSYVILLTLVFLLESLSVGLAIYYRSYFLSTFQTNLKHVMIDNYLIGKSNIIEATDTLQMKYKCCGSIYYTDWNESIYVKEWNKTAPSSFKRVPESCCRTRAPGCGEKTHPSNIYHQGCVFKFYHSISKNLEWVEYIGLGCGGAQFFGILFGIILIVFLKKDVKYRVNYHNNT